MKKRIVSILLATVMLFTAVPVAFAASDDAFAAADALHELGLFNGTGTDANGNPVYDLDRAPSRQEAVTMLVRLLGKETEAKSGTWEIPFTDVADWAKPYVGYAYANGLTSGTSATTFGGNSTVTAAQYITFILRTLGYESGTDFQWDKSWELADAIGLTSGEYSDGMDSFTRGDVAVTSCCAYKMQEVLKTASYWGLPSDIRWISEPKTVADLDNNILYSFLFGNYSLYFSNVVTTEEINAMNAPTLRRTMQQRIKSLSLTYPELVGVFSNTFVGCGRRPDYMFIDFPQASLTTAEIYRQQLAALETAKEMRDKLHEDGKIKSGMTEKQIAQVYYNYLRGLGVTSGGGSEAAKQGKSVEYDSPYACLVNKKADCVGKAGAFNLLMHLEGIASRGVSGSIKGTDSGHVLSCVTLDGKTYYCDWGNAYPLAEDISSWFVFD